MDYRKTEDYIMHVVLDDNEHTRCLAKWLDKRGGGLVTVIDPKYRGMVRKGEVLFTNMDIARESFHIPDKLYFYAYIDRNKKKN